MVYKDIPKSVQKFMEDITQKCGDIHADWAKNFTAAFANTLLTTVKKQNDGTTDGTSDCRELLAGKESARGSQFSLANFSVVFPEIGKTS